MRIRFAMTTALCCLSLAGVAIADDKAAPLRLASDVWPPFTDVEGKARVALDLVHEALRRGGVAANSEVRTDLGDVVAAVRRGELDGSAALWHSAERDAFLLFSKPYLENRLVLVGLVGSAVDAASFDALAGKRIAVVASYAYGEEVENARGPQFVEGPSDNDNLQRLLRGEVDYVLADELLVNHLFARYEAKAQRLLRAGSRPLATRSLHFALRSDVPNAAAIIATFDGEIRRMMTDGSYNEILQMDWIQADVDGDGKIELILAGREAGVQPPTRSYQVFSTERETGIAERLDVGYYIAGQRYEDWATVPAQYKVPTKTSLQTESDTGRPAIVLFDF